MEDKMGRRYLKAPSYYMRRGFFAGEEVDPMDLDCDMDDADMGMAIMKSLKTLMRHHGKS